MTAFTLSHARRAPRPAPLAGRAARLSSRPPVEPVETFSLVEPVDTPSLVEPVETFSLVEPVETRSLVEPVETTEFATHSRRAIYFHVGM